MKEKKKMSLAMQIFIALVLAIIAGLLMQNYADFATNYIKPFGTIFLNLIKFIVCPIVLFSIMCGIISMSDIKKVGSIGLKTVVFYLCTTAFAVTIGLVGGNLFKGIRYTGAASELFLMDAQGTVLAALDTDLIGTKQLELLQSARKKTEKISYNGTTCSVVYSYQPQMHCYIMSLINQEQILKDAHIFRNAILISMLICIGLMIPMFFFINYSVQPIYRLIRRMSKTKDGQLDLTSKIEESAAACPRSGAAPTMSAA